MIISNSRNFIFVHVHKCAGTTITHHLSSYSQWNDIELGGTEYGESVQAAYRKRFGLWKHVRVADIREVIGEPIFGSYFKFGFVRNPFYRLISYFTFIKKMQRNCAPEMLVEVERWPISTALKETSSFSEFIRHPEFREPPMFRLLTDAPKRPLKLLVDFVGKVEAFDRDFANVCERIGIEPPDRAVKHNISQGKGQALSQYYSSEEDLQFAYEKYQKDFDLFGYSLDEGVALFRAGQ